MFIYRRYLTGAAPDSTHVIAAPVVSPACTVPVRRSAPFAQEPLEHPILLLHSCPQQGYACTLATAAATVHPPRSCTWAHDRHRCTSRCARIRYACPERRRAPPITPTDPPTLTAMRRLACCRRPLTIGATSRGRAPGGRSVEYIVSDDCRPSGAVGAGPAREEQRVPSRW